MEDLIVDEPVSLLFAPAQGLRHNPPVTIEDWPDIDLDEMSDVSEANDIPANAPDCDPDFIEWDEPPSLDRTDEPLVTDEDMMQLLQMEYGDLDDNEWIDMYTHTITTQDRNTLRLLATRLRTHFSRQTWDDLRNVACHELKIPSEFVAWRRLRILSGLETRAYDCCVNSCCCFLGRYKDFTSCPFCKEARFKSHGVARRHFHYTPLIPQLCGLFQDASMTEKLGYRVLAEQKHQPGKIVDVFDSEHYRSLRATVLDPTTGYQFFDNPQDIALGLATDGVTLFKRRSETILKKNVLCVGVIPGPKQCKDMNSFLIPLLDELLELESGIKCPGLPTPNCPAHNFVFRAFVIIIFDDIPAIAKLLMMKGHNAIKPCRACMITGVLCRLERSSVYYAPLADPDDENFVLTFEDLKLRTHQGFLDQLEEIEAAPTQTARKKLAQKYGLNGRSIFTRLRSINLAICAPYDTMHLLFENLVPNMIKQWTGQFKGLDRGSGNYQMEPEVWAEVGLRTVGIRHTIPSSFVSVIHNIAEDGDLYTAELYAFWVQYIAPIALQGKLPKEYYDHFLLMRDFVTLSIQLEITHEEIDKLQHMINEWVADYELLYYQYLPSRLPTCTLTIHALLHLPMYIRQTGPLWASWSFVMEQFCGNMLPAVKNRTKPYDHLDNFIQQRAQMQIVSCLYGFPSLCKPTINYSYSNDERISSHEKVYPGFLEIVLGRPVSKSIRFDDTDGLPRQMHKYFATVYAENKFSPADLRSRIDVTTLVRYGKFRLAGDGDIIRTKQSIPNSESARDNSFYDLLPDRNAAFRNRPDQPFRQTYYGQVLDVYYVEFVTQKPRDATEHQSEIPRIAEPYLLVRIQECKTQGLDATDARNRVVKYSDMHTPDIIHLNTISAVVGRMSLDDRGKTYAIIDRSTSGARTQFVDATGDTFD
ncbi:hypothetical protein OPQ81_007458 [Rhizoctonia solani]|nr:hypothetical protein OPQ81_007458 [Rhizoctonia solani]